MTDRHKNPPVPFRPDPENRDWLRRQKEAGTVVNALINDALRLLRRQREQENQP